MIKRRSILVGLAAAAGVVAVTLLVLGTWLVHRSHPVVDGSVSVAAMDSSVEVGRDAFGYAHLRAGSLADVYRATGFVHAQDRLWQMELFRRVGEGRLSEVVGQDALPVDRLFRTLGLTQVAAAMAGALDAETRAALEQYAEGVNAGIAAARGRYPVEFDILGFEPEPWRLEQSLLVSRLMAWELDYSRWMDILLSVLVARVGEEKASELFPVWDAGDPTIIPEPARRSVAASLESILRGEMAARRFLGPFGAGHGSNAWAISGSRTARGKPLLANDPHLLLMIPGRFYEVHQSAPGLDVAGATIPGIPFVIIGRNRAIAWGLTNAMIDDHDFYVEEVDSVLHPSRYRVDGAWRDVSVRTDTIVVKDADPVLLTTYATHRGPLVNRIDVAARWSSALISMRWTGHDVTNDARSFRMLNMASRWDEAEEALRWFNGPAQSVVYADTAGNIAVRVAGRVPVRPARAGLLPSDGRTSASDWKGVVPFDHMPSVLNPPQGYIVSANNSIIGPRYPYHLSHLWEPPWRARRINEVLQELAAATTDDMERLQQDVVSPLGRSVAPLILQTLTSPEDSVRYAPYLSYLSLWQHTVRREDVAPSIFEAFYHYLMRETFADEMGPDMMGLYDTLAGMPMAAMERLLARPASPWFDDVRTPGVERRDDIIRRAFALALDDLQRRLGPDVRTWRWERLHTMTFEHVFGSSPVLAPLFNRGPLPYPGSHATVNVGYYSLSGSFAMTVGPSFRQIVDLADGSSVRTVMPPGQSGQLFHAHYDDQVRLWQAGAYKVVQLDDAGIRRSVVARLYLNP